MPSKIEVEKCTNTFQLYNFMLQFYLCLSNHLLSNMTYSIQKLNFFLNFSKNQIYQNMSLIWNIIFECGFY